MINCDLSVTIWHHKALCNDLFWVSLFGITRLWVMINCDLSVTIWHHEALGNDKL